MGVTIDGMIRGIVAELGRLQVPMDRLDDDADLYLAGLTSHASVSLMLGLEDAFGIEFPDALLRKQTFQSISSIRAALISLGVESS